MAPKFLPLLFIFYLSSSTLLSPGATVCVPRSGPYDSLLRDYLPPPKFVRSSRTSVPHAASPSPSPSNSPPSTKPSSPSSSPPTPKSTPTPSKTSSPVPPVSKTTSPPTPAPKPTPGPSKTSSPVPPVSPTASPPAPKSAPGPSKTPSPAPPVPSTASPPKMAAIKSKTAGSDKWINVLDGSLKAICDKLPFPDLCMTELPSAAEDDIKAIDLNRALGLAIVDLLNEARATRDKARALVTNDFVYDPINLCNRTMGAAMSNSKDALASHGLKDWGSVKSNFDSYVHRLGVCTERKPQGLMAEMEKMNKLWQNANAILCTIDPKLNPAS